MLAIFLLFPSLSLSLALHLGIEVLILVIRNFVASHSKHMERLLFFLGASRIRDLIPSDSFRGLEMFRDCRRCEIATAG